MFRSALRNLYRTYWYKSWYNGILSTNMNEFLVYKNKHILIWWYNYTSILLIPVWTVYQCIAVLFIIIPVHHTVYKYIPVPVYQLNDIPECAIFLFYTCIYWTLPVFKLTEYRYNRITVYRKQYHIEMNNNILKAQLHQNKFEMFQTIISFINLIPHMYSI